MSSDVAVAKKRAWIGRDSFLALLVFVGALSLVPSLAAPLVRGINREPALASRAVPR